ncbi:hypothetical protein GF359_05105 [candidate division WOR-3 bacterium]|uniref:Uncharacterized protein n=1 Tax=candidate division WOR-3 bacterium TaxID=2052148 RepID=A0A9D5QCI0_UNCW3|nr:hypothetical protein [candidate division WOR-3 bacterium]MBD3364574.1 hypothetical protein [candidate division WOR-3 bacterium]
MSKAIDKLRDHTNKLLGAEVREGSDIATTESVAELAKLILDVLEEHEEAIGTPS